MDTVNENRFSEAVIALYEGVTDPGGFSAALGKLSSLTKSPHSIFILWPNGASGGTVEDAFHGSNTELVDRYNSSYNALDPTRDVIPRLADGAWYYDRRDLPKGFIERSAFYQDFFFAGGLGCMVATRAAATEFGTAYFGQQRLRDQSVYSAADLQLLSQISPHLMKAARLRFELEGLRSQVTWYEGSLNQLRARMFLCDNTSRVLFMNRSAEDLLRDTAQPLRIRAGYLASDFDNSKLQKAIRHATGLLMNGTASAVKLGTDSHPVIAWVVPIPAHRALATPWQRPLTLVWLNEADEDGSSYHELLKAAFGLTGAECRISDLLYADLSPAECAEQIGVSLATIRTQIRALYAKLGCNRQTTLVRTLRNLRSPARTV